VGSSIEGDLAEIRDDIARIDDTISGVKETLAGHDVRFSNGREIMGEMKSDIASLKPKAPDWLKLLGVVIAMLGATLGAHYWLIEQFNERPTDLQIEKAFHEHSENGHAGTQRDVGQIRETQTEQRVLLDGLKTTVTKQGEKLDTILERLPPRRR
jgi:hypothetical protein